jgi:hypothetical protein
MDNPVSKVIELMKVRTGGQRVVPVNVDSEAAIDIRESDV